MPKILVVDDDNDFRQAILQVLTGLGHQTVQAANGKLGHALFTTEKPDLVLSDIQMPDMDGLALTKAIKQKGSTPVILMTGFADLLETRQAHGLGADEFLPKPFQPDELKDAVNKCLVPAGTTGADTQAFCRIGIDDFIHGRQIKFNVFVKLGDAKFAKIAYKGEDISVDRIRAYKEKGIHSLYLLREDFKKYVSFTPDFSKSNKGRVPDKDKRQVLLKRTADLLASLPHASFKLGSFDGCLAFVHTTVEVLTEDATILDALYALSEHTDYVYLHSLGVGLYGAMLAQALKLNMPANRFKIVMGGLLHDIGLKDIDVNLLMKPRSTWGGAELGEWQTHPERGEKFLREFPYMPDEVLQMVKQHHEDCTGNGFPMKLRRATIYPLAKLISVVDEFTYLVVKNPHHPVMKPDDAVHHLQTTSEHQLEKAYLQAFAGLISSSPAPAH